MKRLIVVLWLLLLPVSLLAQERIPQGETIYGPIPVGAGSRGRFSFDRRTYTDPAIRATVRIHASSDGVTFDPKPVCGFTTRGGSPIRTAIGMISPVQDIANVCQLPIGTTHVEVVVTTTGQINMARPPRLETSAR